MVKKIKREDCFMKGTIVNVIAIIAGSSIGFILKNKFPEKVNNIIMQALGLCSLLIGMQMALKTANILLVIFSLVIGGIVGELIGLEDGLEKIGKKLKTKFSGKVSSKRFVEGFITTSLLFCVGSMAIVGSLQEGLNGNPELLYTKSLLDGITSIAFSAAMGLGVMFSAIPTFLYQGGITLLAHLIRDFLTLEVINEITGVGGILVLGIGFNLLELKKIKVGNLLPSLLIVFLLAQLF